ncbi:MAG TPA: S41 family peptidase [Thermoanaerobaculia bacterium]|nr:S41 family peptidase [Thermoanaerobaculia bacterium]
MSKSKTLGFLASLTLLLALLVVLPGMGAEDRKDGKDGLYRPLGLFTDVLSLVRSNYVEPVEVKPLLQGAFSGMTESMDPFAEYVPPERMAAFASAEAARAKKDVVDVGIVLARRFGYPVVVSAVEGSPAAVAGLKSDDVIETIDGTPGRALALWEAEAKLSGKSGSRVKLLVVREGKPRRRTIDVLRAAWTPAGPSTSRVEGETVVRIPDFIPGTADAVKKILSTYDRTKPLILDLRGNALGEFEEAARTAAFFVPAGILGEMKGKKIETISYKAQPGERMHEGRVVVLVDSGTAGAAELFASALHDTQSRSEPALAKAGEPPKAEKGDGTEADEDVGPARDRDAAKAAQRVRLVGEPTCGMGFKSQVVKLASGGSLKLSVGKLHTPRGKVLSPRGVEPDDRVFPLPPDESSPNAPSDPVLQRGLKILAEASTAASKTAA